MRGADSVIAFIGFTAFVSLGLFGTSCAVTTEASAKSQQSTQSTQSTRSTHNSTAIFAGGCFWSTEDAFEKVPGVIRAVSGFTGGAKPNPSYAEVSMGKTGHVEAVEVTYDAKIVSYEKLLDTYWRSINPTQDNGQFFDIGDRYRTVIFYSNDAEKKLAEESKVRWNKSKKFGGPIVTQIKLASAFYPAEDEHQDFAKNDPERYYAYKKASGRESYFKKLWGSEDTQSSSPNSVAPLDKVN